MPQVKVFETANERIAVYLNYEQRGQNWRTVSVSWLNNTTSNARATFRNASTGDEYSVTIAPTGGATETRGVPASLAIDPDTLEIVESTWPSP